jgi:Zn-dependent membrane protease YugP
MNSELIILLVVVALPLIAQLKIKATYSKYAKIMSNKRINGKDAARKILNSNGLEKVDIYKVAGSSTDHYDPRNKTVSLSNSIYEESSISSIAVAAHECGHAIQDKISYSFMRFRSKMVPVVNITSSISSIFIVLGFFTEVIGFIKIGILLLLVGLLFQLITLTVEFDASRRAKEELYKLGLVDEKERKGVTKVLNAAAFTYVAGFLASALQIVRLVLISRRRN